MSNLKVVETRGKRAKNTKRPEQQIIGDGRRNGKGKLILLCQIIITQIINICIVSFTSSNTVRLFKCNPMHGYFQSKPIIRVGTHVSPMYGLFPTYLFINSSIYIPPFLMDQGSLQVTVKSFQLKPNKIKSQLAPSTYSYLHLYPLQPLTKQFCCTF